MAVKICAIMDAKSMFKYLLLSVVACVATVVFVGTEQRYYSVLQSVLTTYSAQLQALQLRSPFDHDHNTLQEVHVQVAHKPHGGNQVNDIVQEKSVARKPRRGKRDQDTEQNISNAHRPRRKTYVKKKICILRNETRDSDIVECLQVTQKSRNRTRDYDAVKEVPGFQKNRKEKPDTNMVQDVLYAQTARRKTRDTDTVETDPVAFRSHRKDRFVGKKNRVRRDVYWSDTERVNIGLRSDQHLQDCHASEFKHTFPDVDYAFLGYNILKGFPMAAGHDPGFTFPIFKADYSDRGQTADCRYSVPKGLVIVPDVSCVTSFSSTTVKNRHEYDKALSVSANVMGGGWGVSFSASAGYKQASSEIATGESVIILSSANCQYYFSKIIPNRSPMFDDVFRQWVYKLNATNWNPELYFDFFETYGTHFPTELTFGARFTYEHKMTSKSYEENQSKGVDVAVQASYSGLFSAGGGFNMDSSQRKAASDFSESVTTKTITVGAAPPANGDTMTWASEVKNSPVPTAYKLSSFEELFSDRYMEQLKIDHKRISSLIATNKHEYCLYLQRQGKINSCATHGVGIELKGTRLNYHYDSSVVESISECIEKCISELKCLATTICSTCPKYSWLHNRCFLFEQSIQSYALNKQEHTWQSNVLLEKIKTDYKLVNTAVVGIARGFENDNDKLANLDKCEKLCKKDTDCEAYSHCDCPTESVKCQLFSKENILGLHQSPGKTTVFIS